MTLKAARINKDLSIEEAASLIGVGGATLRSWENAKTFPNVIQLKRIEEVYAVSYNELTFLPNGSV